MKKDADPNQPIWFETAAVLLLICTANACNRWMLLDLGRRLSETHQGAAQGGVPIGSSVDTVTFESMVVRLRYVPIVLFLIWRSSLGWSHFGIVKPELAKDVLLGIGLWVVVATLESIISLSFGGHYPWTPFRSVTVPVARSFLLLGDCFAIGFVEELVFRAII